MAKEKLKFVRDTHQGYNFSGTPDEFIKMVLEKVNAVPKGATDITVSIDTELEYGDYYSVLEVSYSRPYTPAELDKEKRESDIYKANRRRTYEQLKKEFE